MNQLPFLKNSINSNFIAESVYYDSKDDCFYMKREGVWQRFIRDHSWNDEPKKSLRPEETKEDNL